MKRILVSHNEKTEEFGNQLSDDYITNKAFQASMKMLEGAYEAHKEAKDVKTLSLKDFVKHIHKGLFDDNLD